MRTIIQKLLPHHAVSWLAHLMANIEMRWIKNYLIKDFIRRYDVNMNEAIESDPTQYTSFNDFFTRQLKSNVRPILSKDKVTSPADGVISMLGSIDRSTLIQAKGQHFYLQDLLGGNSCDPRPFENGSFITIYLSPKDYHRVHMPVSGQLLQMTYVPGRLFSVDKHNTKHLPNLFARNERVICLFETELGKMAVILVGAMIVGSIETAWHGTVTPPHTKSIQTWTYQHDSREHICLNQGEELGLFKLGSTVIVLFEDNNKLCWSETLTANTVVQVNQAIANLG